MRWNRGSERSVWDTVPVTRSHRRRSTALTIFAIAGMGAIGIAYAVRTTGRGSDLSAQAASAGGEPPTTSAYPADRSVAAAARLPASAVRTKALPVGFGAADVAVGADDTVWVAGCSGGAGECVGASSIDLGTGTVRSLPGTPVDANVAQVAAGDGAVFLLSNGYSGAPYHVTRVDPIDGRRIWSVAVPDTSVQGDPKAKLALGAGALWFSDGTHPVVEFAPRTGTVLATIAVPGDVENNGSVGFAFDGAGAWVVGGGSGTALMRIDPESKRLQIVEDSDTGFTQSLAADGRFVWTTHWTTRLELVRVDTENGYRRTAFDIPTAQVAAGDGQVWFLGYGNNDDGFLGEIDPDTGTIVAATELPIGEFDDASLIVLGGRAYVLDTATHSLMTVDPAS